MRKTCNPIPRPTRVIGRLSPVTGIGKLRALSVALSVFLATSACSGPGYYLQAAAGHWKLMRGRQGIPQVIADPETEPELVRRLQTAGEIIAYADDRLGLPSAGSYSDFVATGREAVSWNVVAAPEFDLEPKKWCFLVAGCVPYRGYFEPDKAERSASRLAARGMDVSVTPVLAYSTLGWFRDPLLDTMLGRSDLQLASTLFHELAHQRLYLKGQTGFSEAYARFVENAGVQRWLEDTGRTADLEYWLQAQGAAKDFNELLLRTRRDLARLYDSGIPGQAMRTAKRQEFERLRERYLQLVAARWHGHDHFAGWFAAEVNNASLALIHSYEGARCAFALLFRQAGEDFHEFHRLSAERAKLDKGRLDAWLAQSCTAIAPAGDL